ncbi:sucrose transporter [Striga asiatica]|uniref:Sucrose transporter n=1 Tax=Striga asiatica TaxID=4170 RepID=A0A5A7Q914_STRAF|nr:sucrose transporter [Striga asiatica]
MLDISNNVNHGPTGPSFAFFMAVENVLGYAAGILHRRLSFAVATDACTHQGVLQHVISYECFYRLSLSLSRDAMMASMLSCQKLRRLRRDAGYSAVVLLLSCSVRYEFKNLIEKKEEDGSLFDGYEDGEGGPK